MADQDAKWLEVSLETDGEYAEVVAEVLARFVPSGVALESTAIKPDLAGEGTPTGPVRVRGFIPVDVNLEETRRKLEEALWYLGRIRPEQPLPSPSSNYYRISIGWMPGSSTTILSILGRS
jgi:ribosomal protein L11 methyltransferase